MTLNERVSMLEAKHITNKCSITNAKLIMICSLFVTSLFAVGLITSTEHQQRQISELKAEIIKFTSNKPNSKNWTFGIIQLLKLRRWNKCLK